MAAKRNRCRLLKACETKPFTALMRHDQSPLGNAVTGGEDDSEAAQSLLMRWCLPGKEAGALEDVVSYHERKFLGKWANLGREDQSRRSPTDRAAFINRREPIDEKIERRVDILHQYSFAFFLYKMGFTSDDTGLPSPWMRWPRPWPRPEPARQLRDRRPDYFQGAPHRDRPALLQDHDKLQHPCVPGTGGRDQRVEGQAAPPET